MRPSPPPAVRLASALYELAMLGLPGSFRRAFGREMRADMEALLLDRWMRSGVWAVGWALIPAAADLVAGMMRERRRQLQRFLGLGAAGRRRAAGRTGGGIQRTRAPDDDSGYSLEMGERTMNGMRALGLAVRSLMRRPGFAGIAVLTLGLGMGSVVAIFTVVNGVLLEPLPYPDGDRIVQVEHHAPGLDLPNLNNSPGTLSWYFESADFLSSLAGVSTAPRVLTGRDQPTRVTLLSVTEQFFDVMGVQPEFGRPLGAADNLEGAAPVAVITHDFWEGSLGSDPEVLGQRLELDGVSTEIVGVMPREFTFVQPGPVGMLAMGPLDPNDFGTFGTNGVGRLAEGISVEQAQVRLDALQARITEVFPDISAEFLAQAGWAASVTRMKDDLVDDVATTLWLVLGTVGFVLLIACANVANLFLVRAESRQKEIAVRAAMGAGRGQVAASFLNEAVVLGVAGGLLGILIAQVGVTGLLSLAPEDLPRAGEIGMTPRVLGFAGVLALGTGLVLGLLPMSRYSARAFAGILRDGGRGSTVGRNRHRARNLLVMSQLALALVLLVGSGLMFRSFSALRQVELGFDAEGVLAMETSVGEALSIPEASLFYQEVLDRAAAIPGVQAAAVTTHAPLSTGNANGGSFHIQGVPRGDDELPPVAFYRAVSPGYFDVMSVRLLQGRPMTRADMDGSTRGVWIDQSFAETHFPAERFPNGAVGEYVTWDGVPDGDGENAEAAAEAVQWVRIEGVVGDAKFLSVREDEVSNAYFPLRVGELGYPSLATAAVLVKSPSGSDPTATAPALREIITQVNGQVPVTRVTTMEDVVRQALAGDSVTLVLLGIAAGMALFLGSIGLFGVISYVVSQRTREIGVRIALGAEKNQVSAMVLRQGLGVAAAGVVVGLIGAFGLTRAMRSLLYETAATDPLTFAVAPVVLLAVSGLATWLPARRAARVDPMDSLRQD